LLRSFISDDGKYIFTVLFYDDYNLRITAAADNMKKAIKLEFLDILSMEPIDSSYRPLRLNSLIHNSHEIDNDDDKEE